MALVATLALALVCSSLLAFGALRANARGTAVQHCLTVVQSSRSEGAVKLAQSPSISCSFATLTEAIAAGTGGRVHAHSDSHADVMAALASDHFIEQRTAASTLTAPFAGPTAFGLQVLAIMYADGNFGGSQWVIASSDGTRCGDGPSYGKTPRMYQFDWMPTPWIGRISSAQANPDMGCYSMSFWELSYERGAEQQDGDGYVPYVGNALNDRVSSIRLADQCMRYVNCVH